MRGGPGWGCRRFVPRSWRRHPRPLPTRGRGAGILVFVILLATAALAQTFPPLTGRIVDQANLIDEAHRAAIEAKLKAHEDKTTDQIVVATVRSLEGREIEDYANRLFRAWKLGQAQKNNGVLLLVAPAERKVRIEVGYGLEGALTDALSKVIITTAIAPRFKQGDFGGGIEAGVDAIVSILTGDAEEWQRRATVREDQTSPIDPVVVFIIFLVIAVVLSQWSRGSGPRRAHRQPGGGWIVIPSGGSWGGGWSGGSGGGGFSGGGGSSGGGGASGSW